MKHEMHGSFKPTRVKNFMKNVRGIELNAPPVKHRIMVTSETGTGKYTVTEFRDHGLTAPQLDTEKEVLTGATYDEVKAFVKDTYGADIQTDGWSTPTAGPVDFDTV